MRTLFRIGLFVAAALLFSCKGSYNETELVGDRRNTNFLETTPYGMVSIPAGSFTIGQNDEDLLGAYSNKTKTVSLSAFWMDETEVTNNEYRQFVNWVKDSIVRQKLSEQFPEFLLTNKEGIPYEPQRLNMDVKIDMSREDIKAQLEDLYLAAWDVVDGEKEIDSRKLNYSWSYYDYVTAARHSKNYNYETGKYSGTITDKDGKEVEIKGRSSFVVKERDYIYPDTLCWIRDFTYSYNEPFATSYFNHAGYDNYPVVGVSWKQARAFCNWRTKLFNKGIPSMKKVSAWRLPTEFEWEYAARGGLSLNIFPWGGPYPRNNKGCFLANFKPLRGNYVGDGALRTLSVGSFAPNAWGLYDMAGNVAEWTSTAFNESGYDFIHDMNPDYQYNALTNDPPVLKRKVIRGGSWKDISVFLQCGTRTYEYQDTTKSYIGFRCVRNKVNDIEPI